jgi:hypothetical protein
MRRNVKMGNLLFESDLIKVSKEANKILYFESNQWQLNTYDVIEGVAALIKMNAPYEDKIWDIQVKEKWNSSADKALYWLTGGDKEWLDGKRYKYQWKDVCHIFTHKYSDIIYDVLEKAETLKDIRDGFNKHLPMVKLYEFSLNNGLIHI